MKTYPRGQSTLEYVTLAMLVMAGILVMGPYTVRAINSYFKSSSDAVKDSFSEQYNQTAPVNVNLPNCGCIPWVGAATCGTNSCQPNERYQTRTCMPENCAITTRCLPDESSCCTTTSVCRGSGGGATCHNGQRLVTTTCIGPSTSLISYECIADVENCTAHCLGMDYARATFCNEANDTTNLPDDTTVTYVDSGGCTGAFCEAKCTIPFIAKNSGAYCACPDEYTEQQITSCPVGYINQTGYCPPGYYHPEP